MAKDESRKRKLARLAQYSHAFYRSARNTTYKYGHVYYDNFFLPMTTIMGSLSPTNPAGETSATPTCSQSSEEKW